MGYSKEHIESRRAHIIECAGRLFREHGYKGVSIGRIMEASGATHGGFYAHFRSKEALFEAVVSEQFDFANQLRRLEETDLAPSRQLDMAIEQYLNPSRYEHIGNACTMAASAVDVSAGTGESKSGFTQSFRQLVDEFQARIDGQPEASRDAALAGVALSAGALILARAISDPDLVTELLESAATNAKTIVHQSA